MIDRIEFVVNRAIVKMREQRYQSRRAMGFSTIAYQREYVRRRMEQCLDPKNILKELELLND